MEIFIFWEQSVIRYIYCVNLHTLHYVKYRNVHIPDVLCLSLFCYQSLYWLNFRLFRTVLGYQQASEPSRISRWREAMTGKMSAFASWVIEYRSDDVIKMKFVKLWDLLSYSERTTSKTPTRQKLAIWGKLSLRYQPSYAPMTPYKSF